MQEQEDVPVKTRRSPEQPTRDEVEQHNSHHEPYRSWCPACVAGRGRSFAHSMVDRSTDTYSVIAIDYAYLTGKFQHAEEVEDEGGSLLLCGRD
eukprot:6000319-Karenia_brevis.AAC.1